MTSRAILIGSLTERPESIDLESIANEVDVLEIRADLIGEVDLESIRRRFTGRLLFTLRSRQEGGKGPDSGHQREDRILAAAEQCDLIDLEAERDLYPEILDRVPPPRRVVSWHGRRVSLERLKDQFAEMSRESAHLYKLVAAAEVPRDALAPLVFLKSLARDDVVAFSSSEVASWTRLLAPRLGAPVVYGSVGGRQAAPGQISIERLRQDFGLPELVPVRRLFGIVGRPVSHSLSPRLHNGLYHGLGLEHLYLPFDVPIFGDFWLDVVESGVLQDLGFPLAGLSVTAPFKEVALAIAGAASPLAERIGSANTLVRRSEVWEAESTDPDGVRGPLAARRVDVGGRRAAVLGAGGAGRAAVFGLGIEGAHLTLVNRSRERGRRVASELGIDFVAFEDFVPSDFEVIANATPLGSAAVQEMPFEPATWRKDGVVIDLAYDPEAPTRLVEQARQAGIKTIDGREVLLHQAVQQFRLMNEVAMPLDLGRRILGVELPGDGR